MKIDVDTRDTVLFDDDERTEVTHHAWPGGYRVWYVTDDSEELCAECVQANLSQCLDADYPDSGWFVVGSYTEDQADEAGPCAHCSRNEDAHDEYARDLETFRELLDRIG